MSWQLSLVGVGRRLPEFFAVANEFQKFVGDYRGYIFKVNFWWRQQKIWQIWIFSVG